MAEVPERELPVCNSAGLRVKRDPASTAGSPCNDEADSQKPPVACQTRLDSPSRALRHKVLMSVTIQHRKVLISIPRIAALAVTFMLRSRVRPSG